MKKSQETWGARTIAREEMVRSEVVAELKGRIKAGGFDPELFQVTVTHNVAMRWLDLYVNQGRESVERHGRIARRDELLAVFEMIGRDLPAWVLEKYHLVERQPSSEVHDASAADNSAPYGRNWWFGPPPR